jgi:hypothetical protein
MMNYSVLVQRVNLATPTTLVVRDIHRKTQFISASQIQAW